MNRHLLLFLAAVPLWVMTGCSATKTGAAVSGAASVSGQQTTAAAIEASCALLNTHDLASIFATHTETIMPKPMIASVDHPAFSMQPASGTETSCVFHTFYLPGSHSEIVLQVNYWLDIPGSESASEAWQQAWTASMRNAQSISGVGDGSFYKDGQLDFKKGNLYMTVAATETDWNLSIASDRSKQLALEKQVAEDMARRMQ